MKALPVLLVFITATVCIVSAQQPDTFAWTHPLEWALRGGSAVGPDDEVFLSKPHRAEIDVLDVTTGRLKRSFSTGEPVWNVMTIHPAGVLYGATPQHLRAWDIHSGERLWSTPMEEVSGLALASEGRLIVTHGRQLMALDRRTGEMLWPVPIVTLFRVNGRVAMGSRGTVYVTDGIILHAIDSSDGNRLWSRQIRTGVQSALALGTDERVFVLGHQTVEAYDGEDGRKLWQRDGLPPSSRDSLITGPDGHVYLTTWTGVHALRGDTGETVWVWNPDPEYSFGFTGGPMLTAEGTYMISAQHHLFGVNVTTGRHEWRSASSFHGIHLTPSGHVIGMADDERFAAYVPPSPATATPAEGWSAWPAGNNANTRSLLPLTGSPVIRAFRFPEVVEEGSRATLSVVVDGEEPMIYQWYRDGKPLLLETQSKIVLSSFQGEHAGNYHMKVNGPLGDAESESAPIGLGFALGITARGHGEVSRAPERSLYPAGSEVTLTAHPGSEDGFIGWSGDVTSDSPSITVIVDRALAIEARFNQPPAGTLLAEFPDGGEYGIGADDSLYINNWKGVTARNAGAQLPRWVFAYGGDISLHANTPPVVVGENAIYAQVNETLRALVPASGTLLWERQITPGTRVGGMVGDNRLLLVTSLSLLMIDAADGSDIATVEGLDVSLPVILSDGSLYVKNHAFTSLLEPLWKVENDDRFSFAAQAAGFDGTIYGLTLSRPGMILAVDRLTRLKKWQTASAQAVTGMVVGPDETVYVTSTEGDVMAIDGVTGRPKWVAHELPSLLAPVLTDAGELLIQNMGKMVAVGATTGERRWEFGDEGAYLLNAASIPVVDGRGVVFLNSADLSKVFLVQASGPLPDAGWPTPRGNFKNRSTRIPEPASPEPAIYWETGDSVHEEGSSVTLEVLASGRPPFTYQWYRERETVPDESEPRLTIASLSSSTTGTYTCEIRNPLGSIPSGPMTISFGLRLQVEIAGHGHVSLDPPGGIYPEGTLVTLRALPGDGRSFQGWSGVGIGDEAERTLTMTQPSRVGATFSAEPGDILWRMPFGGLLDNHIAIDSDGRVFAGATNGRVTAIDPAMRSVRWAHDGLHRIEIPILGVTATDKGVVYGCHSSVFALDASSGSVIWTSPGSENAYLTPSADGMLYNGARAIRDDTGEALWQGISVLRSAVLSHDGALYGSGDTQTLAALDRSRQGRPLWQVPLSRRATEASLANDGMLYLDNGAAVDTRQRTVVWHFHAGHGSGRLHDLLGRLDSRITAPAIDKDRMLYYGANDGFAYALRPDGVVRWAVRLSGPILGTPALLGDGSLLVASGSAVSALDAATGRSLWSSDAGATITGPLNVGPDGTIYASAGYELIAMAGSSPLDREADWPRHRGDAGNTGSRQLPPGPPEIAFATASGPAALGELLDLRITAGGTSPLRYQWYRNGVDLGGQTGSRLEIRKLTPDELGDYHVVISNTSGSIESQIIRVEPGFSLDARATGGGWIVSTPDKRIFSPNESVLLEARPHSDQQLLYWTVSDAEATVENPLQLIADRPLEINGRFTQAPGGPVWETSLPGIGGLLLVLADGQVVVNTDAGLTSLDGASGRVRWRSPVTTSYDLLGHDGLVLAWGRDRAVHALDSSDGSLAWTTPLESHGDHGSLTLGPGHSIVVSMSSRHASLDYRTGEILWKLEDTHLGSVSSLPDGRGFSMSGAIDLTTGEPSWVFDLPFNPLRPPSIGGNGSLYLTGGDQLAAVDLETGRRSWVRSFGEGVGPPTIGPGEVIYVASERNTYAISSRGEQLWATETNAPFFPPVVSSSGLLYQLSSAGVLNALSADTGEVIHSTRVVLPGGYVQGTRISLAADGSIYVVKANSLAALQGSSGLAESSWPSWRGDSANRGMARIGEWLAPRLEVFHDVEGAALQVHGENGQRHVIEHSHDLQPWTPAAVLQSGAALLPDTPGEAAASRSGFFRIRNTAAQSAE